MGLSSEMSSYVNSVAEIIIPSFSYDNKGKESNESCRGVVDKVDKKEMYIVCSIVKEISSVEGRTVKVNLFREGKMFISFQSVINKLYRDNLRDKYVFVINGVVNKKVESQRAKPRVNVMLPSILNMYSLKGTVFPNKVREKKIKSFIMDVSETGAQVGTNLLLPNGMRISLAFSPEAGKELMIDGDILWSKRDRGLYRYGIRFISASPDERMYLRQIVSSQGKGYNRIKGKSENSTKQ